MIGLLALRNLVLRPWRSLFLLLGYGLGVAVMIVLLAIGAAKLWCDRGKKRFYLLVSLEVETPDPTPDAYGQVLGVDVGQRYLATVATTSNSRSRRLKASAPCNRCRGSCG